MNSVRLQALGLFLLPEFLFPFMQRNVPQLMIPPLKQLRRLILQPNPNLKRTPFLSPLSRWSW